MGEAYIVAATRQPPAAKRGRQAEGLASRSTWAPKVINALLDRFGPPTPI